MKKITLGIILLIVVSFGAYMVLCSKNEVESIKIGALFPLTGGLATYGEPAQKAVQLAVNEINAQGGIDGKKIEVDFQDHKCDSKIAISSFQQLNSVKDIKLYMGVGCSGTVLALAPQIKDSILLVSAVTSPKVTGSSPLIFRNYASDADESRLFGEYVKNSSYKTLGSIYEETDYAKGLFLNLENNLNGSGVQISKESFVSGSTDVKTQVTKIKSSNPDVVFVSVQTVSSGDIVLGEMIKQNFKPKHIIVNENILKSTELVKKYSVLLEGAISADYVTENNEKLDNLLKKYKETYGEDCPQKNICSTMYDNVYLLVDAVKSSDYDVKKIKTYLEQVSFEGTSGTIGFDKNNDRKNAGYTLFKIKNGNIEKIK